MENKKINITDDLLIKYILGETDNPTNVEIENWIKKNSENQEYFNKMQKVWDISENAKEFDLFNTENALNKVKRRLDIDKEEAVNQAKVRKLFPYLAFAASIIIIVGIFFFINKKGSDNKIIEVELLSYNTSNEKSEITLPDGTLVYLNSNSEISYPKYFYDKKREINFKGEAYFVVSPDKTKPFVINTQNSKIEVVGTEFNLRAIEQEETESIIVAEGKVVFSDNENVENIELTVGEKATNSINDKKIEKELNQDENFLAWKTGILKFNDKNLDYVFNEISKFYNVEFVINNEEIKNEKFSSPFDNLSIEEVILVIEATFDLKITKEDNKYVVNK